MTIIELLEAAGVEFHYGTGEDEINVCCPFCVDRGESSDSRFRLGINTASGAAHCFNCDFRARTVNYTGTKLGEAFGVKFRTRRKPFQEFIPKKVKRAKRNTGALPEEYEAFGRNDCDVGKVARKYLESRGVSTLQIVRHKIGYAAVGALAWRVLFPVIDGDGKVHGCVARAIKPQMQPKYLNTPGVKVLWNAQPQYSTAVVCEGVLDALHVETALLQMRDAVAVAQLGKTVTDEQLLQLRQYQKVIVLPDYDRAGVAGAINLCTRCEAARIQVYVHIPPKMNGLDPGSLSEDDIVDAIRGAVRWKDSSAESEKTTQQLLRLAATRGGEYAGGSSSTT